MPATVVDQATRESDRVFERSRCGRNTNGPEEGREEWWDGAKAENITPLPYHGGPGGKSVAFDVPLSVRPCPLTVRSSPLRVRQGRYFCARKAGSNESLVVEECVQPGDRINGSKTKEFVEEGSPLSPWSLLIETCLECPSSQPVALGKSLTIPVRWAAAQYVDVGPMEQQDVP